MDRLLSMEVFVSVVDLGSFTAAGQAFRISPPMVSKHISELEKRLGSTLLTRTTRRQHLTEAGQKYYENCKKILQDIKLADSGIADMGGSPKGLLRITASVWFGTFILAPIICDYLREYKEMQVELSLTDRLVDLVNEGFDLAIRIGELSDSSLVARRVSIFHESICGSPDYLEFYGIPITPEDLAHHKCLGFTNWRTQNGWNRVTKKNGRSNTEPSRFISNNAQAMRTAALKGIGLIMMPRGLIQEDIKNGHLVEVLKDFIPPARPIHAVYARELQHLSKLSSFVDFLTKKFNNS